MFTCAAVAMATEPALAKPPAKPAAAAQKPEDLVDRGRALFEDQQYEESIQTLSAALLRPSNTPAQKVEIYRLLALDYITLGRADEAESAVRGLLVLEPEYRLPASESPRFRDFFQSVQKRWEAEGRPGLATPEAPPKPIVLKHASPSQVDPDRVVELRGRLEDPDARIVDLRLYYRAGTKGDFESVEADRTGGAVVARIPASSVRPPLVEYFFVGKDAQGEPLLTRGESQAPLRIAVKEPSRGWVLPVAIGGGILGAAAIVGGLALAGVFSGPDAAAPRGTVSVSVREAGFR